MSRLVLAVRQNHVRIRQCWRRRQRWERVGHCRRLRLNVHAAFRVHSLWSGPVFERRRKGMVGLVDARSRCTRQTPSTVSEKVPGVSGWPRAEQAFAAEPSS